MGNQHSHSENHSHHRHSNKYNISTNHHHHKVVTRDVQAISASTLPNNNSVVKKTKVRDTSEEEEITPTKEITLTYNKGEVNTTNNVNNKVKCICGNLQCATSSPNELINNNDSSNNSSVPATAASSYELVEIGANNNNSKKPCSRRPSYTWRKVSQQELHQRAQQEEQKYHRRDCPLYVLPTTISNPLPGQASTMNSLEKFSKHLATLSGSNGQISKIIFQMHVLEHCPILSEYVWSYLNDYAEKCPDEIAEQKFFRSADKIYLYITDKDQIQFWFKVFAKGSETVDKHDFKQFLLCNYQLSTTKANTQSIDCQTIDDLDGSEWAEAVVKSCYHLKEEMSVIFLSNWIINNLPRLLIPLHKYVVHQLTTGYTQLTTPKSSCNNNQQTEDNTNPPNKTPQQSPKLLGVGHQPPEKELLVKKASTCSVFFHEEKYGNVSTMNPILLWLLNCSLPETYIKTLKKKCEIRRSVVAALTPKQLITQLLNNAAEPDSWSILYDAQEHGSSINRFQFHVFHYRGPTLMFITADNGYKICLACDTEWKESCHFWGGEDSYIVQLGPEYRIVETGKNLIYANFSIRGYPFGIQAGKDPRNVSVEIKPDFQYISFKKIPCKIENIVIYGCGPNQAKTTQTEYKKWEAKECEKQKKVNLNPVDWTNNPDKYLLELAGSYQAYGNGNGN